MARVALLAALCAVVTSCRSCLVVTDIVPKSYNAGAIDSVGNPYRDRGRLRQSIVERLVFQELADGYFGQGGEASEHSVSKWLRAATGGGFLTLVRCLSGEAVGPCLAPGSAFDSPMSQGAREDVAQKGIGLLTSGWTEQRLDRPICGDRGADNRALERVVDEVRYNQALVRAARAVAEVLTEGLVDDAAVQEGAQAAFTGVARYLERRRWQRERDLPTTGLVVKGGAATGIFSAGVVWTALNLIHGCTTDKTCSGGRELDHFDFKLVSGTSTGAMVAIAVDRFNAAQRAKDRQARLDDIACWFTCLSIHDLYCVRSASIAKLVGTDDDAQLGVLEFDGIEKLLSKYVDNAMLTNRSELVLNSVEFRSGRLFSLSDQYELKSTADVVQAGLASASLPLIGKPVVALPTDPPYDGSRRAETEPAFLDGGIRSEIPVLPLARRGAERTLVVSSAASILGETKRLKNAVAVAARYIDVSTGGVTESELAHAKRHVESTRFAEIEACYEFITRDHPDLCSSGGCNVRAVCEGDWKSVCGGSSQAGAEQAAAPTSEVASAAKRDTRSLALRTEPFWKLEGIFRDEASVDPVNGYDFDPAELQRLFRAGAEAARQRCFDIARLLGIVSEVPEPKSDFRRKLVKWCTPHLVNLCPEAHLQETELRSCTDPPPDDVCGKRERKDSSP